MSKSRDCVFQVWNFCWKLFLKWDITHAHDRWTPSTILPFWYILFFGHVWISCLLHSISDVFILQLCNVFDVGFLPQLWNFIWADGSVKNKWVETSRYRVITGFTFIFQDSCACSRFRTIKRILGRCSSSGSNAEIINETHSLTL